MKKIIIVMLVCTFGLVSCGYVSSVKPQTVCDVDADAPIDLGYVSFRIGSFWKSLSHCMAVQVFNMAEKGIWEVIAMGTAVDNNTASTIFLISMEVKTDISNLGMKRAITPEEWYEKEQKDNEIDEKRAVRDKMENGEFFLNYDKVNKNQMDCWRVERGKWFSVPTSPFNDATKRKVLRYLKYACWPNSKHQYHPIIITAARHFSQGKPVYPDIDLKKDILGPVFASLKVKELTDEQYNQRVQKNKEAMRKHCEESYERYLDELTTKPGAMNNAFMNNMLDCGYNDAKQRRCDALEKHSDALKQNYILTHRKLGYNMERLEETMRVCDYSEEAVADYKQALCANSLKWFSKQLRYKKYRPYTWVTDHLKQCGYENDLVYQEGKQRAIVEGARIIRSD